MSDSERASERKRQSERASERQRASERETARERQRERGGQKERGRGRGRGRGRARDRALLAGSVLPLGMYAVWEAIFTGLVPGGPDGPSKDQFLQALSASGGRLIIFISIYIDMKFFNECYVNKYF